MLKASSARKKVKNINVSSLKQLNKVIKDSSTKGSYCISVHAKGMFVKKILDKLDLLGYYYILYFYNQDANRIYPTVPFLVSDKNQYILYISWLNNE